MTWTEQSNPSHCLDDPSISQPLWPPLARITPTHNFPSLYRSLHSCHTGIPVGYTFQSFCNPPLPHTYLLNFCLTHVNTVGSPSSAFLQTLPSQKTTLPIYSYVTYIITKLKQMRILEQSLKMSVVFTGMNYFTSLLKKAY